jgi:hypothetical protein
MMQKTSPWNLEVELDGVEIVREMPVSIKVITIVYNTDSLKRAKSES